MRHWVWFGICALLGLVMLVCGLLVPAHLRAVDASTLQKAGRSTPTLVEQGLRLVKAQKLGAAQMLFQAAQTQSLPGRAQLVSEAGLLALQHPPLVVWGCPAPRLESLFKFPQAESKLPKSGSEPFTDFIVREQNRQKVLENLAGSPQSAVQELLRCRGLTNTYIFSPSGSASGQAFDAAIALGGLLLDSGHISTNLADRVYALTASANRGEDSHRLEQALLDFMTMGQRLNWGQLTELVSRLEDTEGLRLLANQVRLANGQLPELFSAIELDGSPVRVTQYLMTFSRNGLSDLATALRFGTGGIAELLQRNQRLYQPRWEQRLAALAPAAAFADAAANLAARTPWLALALKWLLYLGGGFWLAAALHFALQPVSLLELPLQVRGFHIARETLFALGFLLVVLLFSEPFLAQPSQKVDLPFRLRLPTVGSAAHVPNTGTRITFMNQPFNLLTMLLFFVLQALIYTACVVKLAEIRRQRIPSRLKLKLLENEDHLFDAGLYLGFAGTIVSLILVSLGIIQPSLMAAYSSTSFGIIFVSVFKIFHLRPARRKLLLEAETGPAEAMPGAPVTLATPS